MRIVADENIPARSIEELGTLGHSVIDVRRTELRGGDDEPIWSLAQNERAVLVTTDKGFASHWDEPHFGILIVRLRQPNRRSMPGSCSRSEKSRRRTGRGCCS